jgi:hypothetical protein
MASGNAANVVAFPDLPPKGSRSYGGGKRALMGPEIGTQFDLGQRLFAYYLWRRGCLLKNSTTASSTRVTTVRCSAGTAPPPRSS